MNSHYLISLEYLRLVVRIVKHYDNYITTEQYKSNIRAFLDKRQAVFENFYDTIKTDSQDFFYDFSMLNEKSDHYLKEINENQTQNFELI